MALLKQSTARVRSFLLVLTSDHLTGATSASPVVTISKNGAAFGAAAGAVAELTNGWYTVSYTTADTGTLGDLAVHVTGTAADPSDWTDEVLVDLPGGTVSSVTGAVGSVTAGVTVTTNNDKTGYTLTVTPPTAATISTTVWDELTATARTAGTYGQLLKDDINATISSRMATYTQPTGFLAATFPSGTIANTTNITAGTITTATSVTNAVVLAAKDSLNTRNATAQAGAATTITLDSSASATDNIYNGQTIKIDSATGAGQARVILSYVGSTKVATVNRAWQTNPDSTSVFTIVAGDHGKTNSSLEVVSASVTGAVGSVTGAVGSVTGLTASNLDATISSRMASYTQPTGFLAATFPAGTVASTTNITAGTITTATNVTTVSAGGIVAASFGVSAIDASALATDAGQEIADRILARAVASGSDTGRTIKMALQRLVNRVGIAAGTMTVYAADDVTASWTGAVTTTAGNPVSDVDPV